MITDSKGRKILIHRPALYKGNFWVRCCIAYNRAQSKIWGVTRFDEVLLEWQQAAAEALQPYRYGSEINGAFWAGMSSKKQHPDEQLEGALASVAECILGLIKAAPDHLIFPAPLATIPLGIGVAGVDKLVVKLLNRPLENDTDFIWASKILSGTDKVALAKFHKVKI
jgi:hypothetical protein